MKHKTRLPRDTNPDIPVNRMSKGRRGKLKLICPDITYHVYPKNAQMYSDMWEGSDSDKELACTWLGEELGYLEMTYQSGQWVTWKLRGCYT